MSSLSPVLPTVSAPTLGVIESVGTKYTMLQNHHAEPVGVKDGTSNTIFQRSTSSIASPGDTTEGIIAILCLAHRGVAPQGFTAPLGSDKGSFAAAAQSCESDRRRTASLEKSV